MSEYFTKQYYKGKTSAHRRAVYKGIGLTDYDLDRPLIAVVNTYSEVCPGHHHLQTIMKSLKNGIWQAGATPLEFSTISQCATQTLGLDGIRYDLPARELIALDIETIVATQLFDGLVVVTTCDKTIPGVLIGASRLDMPTIIIPGGIMCVGNVYGNEVSLADLDEKIFSGKIQNMTYEEIQEWENNVIPGDGACPIMGTANTMQLLSEFLGISMPFSSTKIANTASQLRLAKQAGYRIVDMVNKDFKFSEVVTRKSMSNMIKACMAIGGASNSILHMLALSYDMGFGDEINIDFIANISKEIPCIVDIKPIGSQYITYLEQEGGVPAIMSKIKSKLNQDCLSVSGKTIGEICSNAEIKFKNYEFKVIHNLESPIMKNGGIIVLKGNIAESSIVRAFKHSKNKFVGQAKVFESQQEAVKAVKNGIIKQGDVIVLRFMGPKGGPGMPDCFGVAAAVVGAGLEEAVAVITDGRFSGFAKGIGVCQICPEAASGGALSKIKDGDTIVIDTNEGLISDEADGFLQRVCSEPPLRNEKGILRIYSKIAGSASTGARL